MDSAFINEINLLKKELVSPLSFIHIDELFPHEDVFLDRLKPMLSYINSLHPHIIIPSILISKNNMIIDGHHRYHALLEKGITKVPVNILDYESPKIVTHNIVNKQICKNDLVKSALSRQLLKPKSSLHHVIMSKKIVPIIVFSELIYIGNEK